MALADDSNEPDYGTYGVRAQRTSDPVNPPPIDRQRIYMGSGQNLGTATGRAKVNGGGSVNATKPSSFALRKRKA